MKRCGDLQVLLELQQGCEWVELHYGQLCAAVLATQRPGYTDSTTREQPHY